MNKKLYLLPLLLLVLVFTSCEETVTATKYENWQPRNEAFMDSLQQVYDAKRDPALQMITPLTDPYKKIFYKDITPAGTKLGATPLYTDSVQVYYRGNLITGEVFDYNFAGKEPNPAIDIPLDCYISPYVVRPQNWPILTVITGWGEALQHMKEGQRWEVYIPSELCYQERGKGNIPGYSALTFDLQLVGLMPKQ